MSFINDSINYLKTALNSAGDTVQSWSQEWTNTVANFKTKAKQFVSDYEQLKSREKLAQSDPALANEYESLMSKGNWIYDTIISIARKIDFIGDNQTMNSLGALPLIPIAVIVGAIAAMTAWLADAYTMKQKLDSIERLQAGGADAVDIADAINNKGSLINVKGAPIQSLLILGVAGFALYAFWPQLKKALK